VPINERADERIGNPRIADPGQGIDLLKPRHEAIIDAVMDEEAAQRRAALAGRPNGGKGDGAHRKIQISG
jgi:hypothetical protein